MNRDPQEPTLPEPVAIIGIGCMFPGADDLESFWRNIRDGVDAITEPPDSHWDPADYFDPDPNAPDKTYGRRGGFLDVVGFDPREFGVSPRDVESTDTSQLLGMAVAKRALADAGYSADSPDLDRERTSVILGVTGTLEAVIPLGARLGHPIWRRALADAGVDQTTAEDVVARISESYVGWQENSFPGLLGNVVAGRIANRLDLHGTNCVVDAACASSLGAVHLALLELQAGRSDLVVTGGVDTFNDIFMYMCFSKTPALSPTGDARPFAEDGDGTILGEGLGMLVLKRLSDAERDGDRIYAVIRGLGSSSDGKGDAVYAPTASGQARCLRSAYNNAGVDPSTIELIEAHGTGTKVGDATEIRGLNTVFGSVEADTSWCALGSVKSMIGHTKAAAGAAGLIKAALALHHKVLPPTIKVERPNEAASPGTTPFYINTVKRPWLPRADHLRRAGVSAFGFGGSNFHCVLEEYDPYRAQVDWEGQAQIIACSTNDRADLLSALDDLVRRTLDQPWATLRREAARTRASFDPSARYRLTVVLDARAAEPASVLGEVREYLHSADDGEQAFTKGPAYFRTGPRRGKLAAIFPGQGSQYPGMLRDLACRFPSAQQTLATADRVADIDTQGRLSDAIYPQPAFDDHQHRIHEDHLRQTEVAQPAIGAVSLAAIGVLNQFGVRFDGATGHSFGELTALCVAGCISESDFHRLAHLRGSLMAGGPGDRGTMLAVLAEEELVDRFLSTHDLDLVIANRNAPKQFVLSGATPTIERAAKLLGHQRVPCKLLSVSAAFHSPLVAEASAPFAAALSKVPWATGSIPVYANTTSAPYPIEEQQAKTLLADQLATPVEFQQSIERMHADGFSTFVEVGPGTVMKGLVQSILAADRDSEVVSLDAHAGPEALAHVLARLAAAGHNVALDTWDPLSDADAAVQSPQSEPAFTLPVSGANYRVPTTPRPPVDSPPVPAVGTPKPAPELAHGAPLEPGLTETLRTNQDTLQALIRMQEQTADLHRQFLEAQELATRNFQELISRQSAGLPVANDLESQHTPSPRPAPMEPVERSRQPAPAARPPDTSTPAPEESPSTTSTLRYTVHEVLLQIVAEKTGYPAEMLELSMGLDADLGIDSIKRVEILSALQEQLPDAPVVNPEHLGELQTLGHIVDFLAWESSASPIPPTGITTASLAAESTTNPSEIVDTLLAIVAEKTGYPAEMLELSMGLDADLGIDSIKRVEILSALQEQLPDAPVVNPEHLGELQTLGHIVDFLARESSASPIPPTGITTASLSAESTTNPSEIVDTLLAIVAEKTGYPAGMLELSMGLDADLGIDSIKRVEILSALQEQLPDAPVVKPEHIGELQTLGHIAEFLTSSPAAESPPPREQPAPPPQPTINRQVVAIRRAQTPIEAVSPLPASALIWVTRSDDQLSTAVVNRLRDQGVKADEVEITTTATVPEDLAGLVMLAPTESSSDLLAHAFSLTRRVGETLRNSAEHEGAFLATVSRLDGSFGLDGLSADQAVLSGGLAGLSKTVGHEWPQVETTAIDLDSGEKDLVWAAERLVARILTVGGGEFGISRRGTCTPELVTEEVSPAKSTVFTSSDVVVISGGARGVTAEVAVELARAGAPRLALLGRSAPPTPEPEWLRDLEDEPSLKKAILSRATAKLSPRDLGDQYRKVQSNREVLRNIARMETAGSRVTYHAVDVRDRVAVTEALHDISERLGPITGLIHGAGVLADSYISDKSDADFDRVLATKIDGFQFLLDAVRDRKLKSIVTFSSSTARFGRTGQADYAVANEVLNKIAQREQRRRPDCRVVSVNWGPWDGGMVTSTLREMFADEGISVIDLQAGARYLLDEIASTGGPVEVVILGGGSNLPDTEIRVDTPAPALSALPELPTVLERELNTDAHQFLSSHVIDGQAVLPVAMIVEWLGHGALHGNPGLRFCGFEDLRVFKGVILSKGETIDLRVCADKAEKSNGHFQVPTELCSTSHDGKRTLHASARMVLANTHPNIPTPAAARVLPRYDAPLETLYTEQLFHGPALRGITTVDGCDRTGIVVHCVSSPPPQEWCSRPIRGRWIADPMALDCGFQAMILWTLAELGLPSLPTRAMSFRQFQPTFPTSGTRIEIRVTEAETGRASADIDWLDAAGQLVARMQGYQCVVDASLGAAFRRNVLEERNTASR